LKSFPKRSVGLTAIESANENDKRKTCTLVELSE